VTDYEKALEIIVKDGFPSDTSKQSKIYLNISDLVKLSNKARISVSKLAFYFSGVEDE